MKNLHVAALATLFGISAASGAFASTTLIAVADQDHRGSVNGQNGQCNTNNNNNTRRGDGDQDDQNNQNNQNNQGKGRGKKRGWQNPNNPHYCGSNGNCGYNNGQNNGQCNNNGQGQGNTSIRGTITSVNGNQVTVMEGFGQTVTINDQPALDNQSTGRVVVGRYVTAYGYYQNGIFYATSMQ
jgi:hypothetical protein